MVPALPAMVSLTSLVVAESMPPPMVSATPRPVLVVAAVLALIVLLMTGVTMPMPPPSARAEVRVTPGVAASRVLAA